MLLELSTPAPLRWPEVSPPFELSWRTSLLLALPWAQEPVVAATTHRTELENLWPRFGDLVQSRVEHWMLVLSHEIVNNFERREEKKTDF